jgi:TatA/E family protein of Tat protein translocase
MNLGFTEMAFIFFLALIIFGPKKLPEIGRQLGKALNEFKRASNEFKAQIEAEINNLENDTRSETSAPQILPPAQPPQGEVQSRNSESFQELPPPASEPLTGKAPHA